MTKDTVILQCKRKCLANSPDNRLFITVCRGGASTWFFDPVDTFKYLLKLTCVLICRIYQSFTIYYNSSDFLFHGAITPFTGAEKYSALISYMRNFDKTTALCMPFCASERNGMSCKYVWLCECLSVGGDATWIIIQQL